MLSDHTITDLWWFSDGILHCKTVSCVRLSARANLQQGIIQASLLFSFFFYVPVDADRLDLFFAGNIYNNTAFNTGKYN